jgi:hypothetical protein
MTTCIVFDVNGKVASKVGENELEKKYETTFEMNFKRAYERDPCNVDNNGFSFDD